MFTDGPFVESKEYLAGFWVIEAPDLDVALKLAAEGRRPATGRSRCGRCWASESRRRSAVGVGRQRVVGEAARRGRQAREETIR